MERLSAQDKSTKTMEEDNENARCHDQERAILSA
jgi:hypothetical protein